MYQKEYILNKKDNTSLTVYLQESQIGLNQSDQRPFVMVLPGGGYNQCSDKEAEPVALSFVAQGFHAGVLRYHVGKNKSFEKSLEDARMALELVRKLPEKFRVDSNKVAVLGFSAGGHLAAAMSTLLDDKPNLCILGYPAILTSFANVMQVKAPSLNELVTSETPPTFLFSTFEDNVVPIENSLLYLHALEEHDVPFEAHVFQKGVHGLSLATKVVSSDPSRNDPRFSEWFKLCIEWMTINWDTVVDRDGSNLNIDEIPIGQLMLNSNNQTILLSKFPLWKEKSYYKIVKRMNLQQLHKAVPDMVSEDLISEFKKTLTP
jgi:acetyl esterase/lipase